MNRIAQRNGIIQIIEVLFNMQIAVSREKEIVPPLGRTSNASLANTNANPSNKMNASPFKETSKVFDRESKTKNEDRRSRFNLIAVNSEKIVTMRQYRENTVLKRENQRLQAKTYLLLKQNRTMILKMHTARKNLKTFQAKIKNLQQICDRLQKNLRKHHKS